MKALTERQKEFLEYLASFIDTHSYPPTIRETAEHFSVSVKGAYDHVKALERKGFVRLGENRSRALEIVNRDRQGGSVAELPLLGNIAAGKPILAEVQWEGTVRVPAELARHGRCFALKVKGDSMRDAGIHDGDLAIVEARQTAENGEIVVALLDDSATLKRFFRENNRVRLQAENPAFAPIYTQDARILGKLRGIIRTY
jgi:repressor LexA